MKPDNGCLIHLDAVSGRSPLSLEAASHLQICSSCRQTHATMQALRQEKSAWPTQDLSGLKGRILEKIHLEPKPQASRPTPVQAPVPAPSPLESPWWESWFSGPRLALVAGFAMLVLVIGLRFGTPDASSVLPVGSEQHFQLTRATGVTETRTLSETIALASETVQIQAPDGSFLTVTGPARFQVFRRGFQLDTGSLRAQVKPGQTVFTGRTPHGEVTVLGTIFLCRVTEAGTEVRVEEGKVRIVSIRGPERILVAGQSASMIYSAHAGTPGEIRENPAVESDPSQ